MSELIAISALMGDRSYRIKINPADEEIVRKTLRIINDKIVEFKTQYAGKDMQDYIAMVLVWYATEQHTGTMANMEKENLTDQMDAIEGLLDKQLKE